MICYIAIMICSVFHVSHFRVCGKYHSLNGMQLTDVLPVYLMYITSKKFPGSNFFFFDML